MLDRSLDFATNDLKEKQRHYNVFCFDVDGDKKPLVPPGYGKTTSRSNSMSSLNENCSTRVDMSKNKF